MSKTGFAAHGDFVLIRTILRPQAPGLTNSKLLLALPESARFIPDTFTVVAMGARAVDELGDLVGHTVMALIRESTNYITIELDGLRGYFVPWRDIVGETWEHQE